MNGTIHCVVDAGGKVCAHATGTFKFVKRLPVGAKTVNGMTVSAKTSEMAPQGIISTD